MIKSCGECGGPIHLLKRRGRFDTYKGMKIEIPDNIGIATCECCGEEYYNEEMAKQIDEALEKEYQKRKIVE
jgi:hypothetical protein